MGGGSPPELGAFAVLPKPLALTSLMETVARAVAASPGAAADTGAQGHRGVSAAEDTRPQEQGAPAWRSEAPGSRHMDTNEPREAPTGTTESLEPNGQRPSATAGPPGAEGQEPVAPPAPRSRTVRRRLVLGALVLAVGILGAILVWREWGALGPAKRPHVAESPSPSAPTPTAEGPVVSLEPSQLAQLSIAPVGLRAFHEETRATGKIAFNEDRLTPIFSPVPGRVTRLLAKPGDVITPGTPLVELYAPDLVQAEAALIGAVTALAKARTALTLAQRIEARQHELYQNQAAALKDWEQAQADRQNAESDVKAAEAALVGARDALRLFGKSEAEVAHLERTRTLDRLMTVVSPIAGTITARKLGPGQYLRPDNPDPLFLVADLSTMWLVAQVYETDVPRLQVGQPVDVHVMAYPTEGFHATIAYIGAVVNPDTHRVGVRAVVDNPGHRLKPEMFAEFRITTQAAVQTPTVPQRALVREGDQMRVWVAQGDHAFTPRAVTVGLAQEGYVQVVSGLQPGERVVTEGSLLVSNAGEASEGGGHAAQGH
jgi:membrane fusion protein, heavy metal efflux system